MIIYKKNDFLSSMPDVLKCAQNISSLNEQWDNIKLLCEINCPVQSKSVIPNMTKIQKSFFNLQQELIDTLESEKLKKMEQKIISKTQVAIDILIRNLYERTADIGFIATDDDICQFVCDENRSDRSRNDIINRLGEYVAKYSVYDEIIILDKNHTVIANLDQSNVILGLRIDDPILTKTLETNKSFVESFQTSVLQSRKKKSHVFSSKVYNEETNQPIGMICLCFRFENEMKQIFKKLTTDYDGSVITVIDNDNTVIDNDNTVIASSDENHLPLGITVEPVESGIYGIVYYRGAAYISKTVSTKGYQEYFGLGWKGHVMLPLNLGFTDTTNLDNIDAVTATGLMQMADSFSEALNEIIGKTQKINSSLKRIVYNGQIIEKDNSIKDEYARLKPILSAIGQIGTKTSDLFQNSVTNLFSTVITTSLVDSSFQASLCVDIMDRNLYERANDCRWWALNSTFRKILARDEINDSEIQEITNILTTIQSLYTVYRNLFFFDKTGTILAVSNPNCLSDIGKNLDDTYIHDVLNNSNPEKYFVSSFETTDLYDHHHTYIYGASITDIKNSNRTLGGIGIVFDSEDQFKEMLADALKPEGNTFAVFSDRKKNIIATTNGSYTIGTLLNLPDYMFTLSNNYSHSEILVYENCYYAIGYSCSSNYREYKSTDGYQNDILAFVFEKLSDITKATALNTRVKEIEQSDFNYSMTETPKKLGTFVINNQLFGLDESVVLEAIDDCSIISLPGSTNEITGAVKYKGQYIVVINTALFFNMTEQNKQISDDSHLLVLKLSEEELIAIQVDKLMSVLDISMSDIKPVDLSSSISGIVCLPDDPDRTILVLDHHIFLENQERIELCEAWEEALPIIE
ncbi:MAG: chemotaxis protein CheW [Acetobacterium sp.]